MGKNRSMEAKRIKRIKQIRARPRFLKMNSGYMKAHSSVEKSNIPKELLPLYAYREHVRVKQEHDHEAFIDAVLQALYPSNNPPMIVEREHEHMRLKVNAMEPVARKILLLNGRAVKLAMLSNRDLNCIEFLEYQVIPKLLRRSITYNNYDRAQEVFHLGTIRWKTVINLNGVEHAPP